MRIDREKIGGPVETVSRGGNLVFCQPSRVTEALAAREGRFKTSLW